MKSSSFYFFSIFCMVNFLRIHLYILNLRPDQVPLHFLDIECPNIIEA